MWFSFGSEDIGQEMREIKELIVAINDDLAGVRASRTEASTEIVAKLNDLEAQIDAGQADASLVAEIKTLAQGLADVVPNPAPEPTPEPAPTPEPTPEPPTQ